MPCPISTRQLEADPHALLAQLRADGPVTWVPALGSWLVTGWETAVAVLRDPDTFTVDDPRFSTAQVIGSSMLSLDGDEHSRHRRPFAAPFRPRQVRQRFGEFVEATTDRLLDTIADEGSAELRTALAGPLATAVVAESLGLDGGDDEVVASLLSWYRAIVESVSGVAAGRDVTDEGAQAFTALDMAVRTHLDGGGAPVAGDAPPSLLVEAAASAELADDEVVSNSAVLMFGGIETTEGMILNAAWHLLTNPDQLARVRSEPTLVARVVEESLRLEPAAAVVDRYATRDVELSGARIAAGDMVTVSLAGANRDPAVFDRPDRFDVDRPNLNRHLAFAQGPHVCVGMDLARLETDAAIRGLITRFPGLRLDDSPDGMDTTTARSEPRGLVFRKPPHLHVTW